MKWLVVFNNKSRINWKSALDSDGFGLRPSGRPAFLSDQNHQRASQVTWQEGLCPGGSLSRGFLSRGSLYGGISVQGSLSGRLSNTVASGQYASYWNAFLFQEVFGEENHRLPPKWEILDLALLNVVFQPFDWIKDTVRFALSVDSLARSGGMRGPCFRNMNVPLGSII